MQIKQELLREIRENHVCTQYLTYFDSRESIYENDEEIIKIVEFNQRGKNYTDYTMEVIQLWNKMNLEPIE